MLAKIPAVIPRLFKKQIWRVPNPAKQVYLTFDDGPIPEITNWVLDTLAEHQIKASFFCIGDNIRKHPEIFARIIQANHAVGNHTYNHVKGWKTSTVDYINNTLKCQEEIGKHLEEKSKLFRPPYGKITPKQVRALKKLDYQVVMWDIISKDYDRKTTREQCLDNVLKNVSSGSIIIFHDSLKAAENLKYALPRVIKTLLKDGYEFCIL